MELCGCKRKQVDEDPADVGVCEKREGRWVKEERKDVAMQLKMK